MASARDDGDEEAERDGARDRGQRLFANGVLDLPLDGTELVLSTLESRLTAGGEIVGPGPGGRFEFVAGGVAHAA